MIVEDLWSQRRGHKSRKREDVEGWIYSSVRSFATSLSREFLKRRPHRREQGEER